MAANIDVKLFDSTGAAITSSNPLNVRVDAALTTGDIEIGGVEIKNGTDDTRAVVGVGTAIVAADNALAVKDPVSGVSTGAAVVTDANGTLQQYLRGLVKLVVAKIGITVADGDNATQGITTGAAVITDATGTLQQYLRGLVKLWITGGLAVTTRDSASAAVSMTRTNDTNAYVANDVLGAATGSTAALSFPTLGPSAGRIMLTSVSLEIDATAIISGETSYVLHLYNVTPPSALGDNVAFDLPSGDRASYLGAVNLGTPVDLGSTLFIETNGVNKQLQLSGTGLFGYLVTVGAYTPTASRVHVVTLHAVTV